jgi:hypothetical protein
MNDDFQNTPILQRERWEIELLARETHTAIATVQAVYLEEYEKLAKGAHITAFLPLLTSNHVRNLLTDKNDGAPAVWKP